MPGNSDTLVVRASIHDVMPHTLTGVGEILARVDSRSRAQLDLLVVPGLPWSASDIRQLRRWVDAGHELVGHGWLHRARHIRRFRHRLHSRFLSREVAEHLCLDEAGIASLMQRCHDWFHQHDLPSPVLYVPPAWALGQAEPTRLGASGFHAIETLTGVTWLTTARRDWIPLAGFEADTPLRHWLLGALNPINECAASGTGSLRVGIHPLDHRLRLASPMFDCLSRYAGRLRSLSASIRAERGVDAATALLLAEQGANDQ